MPYLTSWTRKVLKINLSNGETTEIVSHKNVMQTWLGGRGLAGHFAKDLIKKEGKEPFLLFTSPLAGSGAPGTATGTIMGISPLSGGLSCESFTGQIPLLLKKNGYDGIILVGKSENPGVLELVSGKFFLEPVEKNSWQQKSSPYFQISQMIKVGQGGIERIHFADLIMENGFLLNSPGLGFALAKKNIWGIKFGDEPETSQPGKEFPKINRLISASPFLAGEYGLNKFGSGAMYDLAIHYKLLPGYNWQGQMGESSLQGTIYEIFQNYSPQGQKCQDCPLSCRFRGKNGEFIPAYGALAAFTSLVGNKSSSQAVAAYNKCVEYGLNPLDTATALAAWSEINSQKVDDLPGAVTDLILGKRFDESLKQGAQAYCRQANAGEADMTIRGWGIFPIHPQGSWGSALGYLSSTVSRGFFSSFAFGHEILGKPVLTRAQSFSGKAKMVGAAQNKLAGMQAMGVCPWLAANLSLSLYEDVLARQVGSLKLNLAQIGQKIRRQEQDINRFLGVAKTKLPPRLYASEGHGFTRDELTAARNGGTQTVLDKETEEFRHRFQAGGFCKSDNLVLIDDSGVKYGNCPQDNLVDRLQKLKAKLGVNFLTCSQLEEPAKSIAAYYFANESHLIPNDSETRTILHSIPFSQSPDSDFALDNLAKYGQLLLADGKVISCGTHGFLEPYVYTSSVNFSLFVKFMSESLMVAKKGNLTSEIKKLHQDVVSSLSLQYYPQLQFQRQNKAFPSEVAEDLQVARLLGDRPDVFNDENSCCRQLVEVGNKTVKLGLVDSYFGNISLQSNQDIWISRSGIPLDRLDGNLVKIPKDGSSTVGIIASSEFSAHRRVYETVECNCILHGHPAFLVILSLICHEDCQLQGRCHLECPHERFGAGVPIVPGEVGTGPYGLVNNIPRPLFKHQGVIVYGHGLFVRSSKDLWEALEVMLRLERKAVREYFSYF